MLFFVQIILARLSQFVSDINGLNFGYWFLYRFPPTRLIDVLIGCLLYLVFINDNKEEMSTLKISCIELFSIVLTIISFVLINCYNAHVSNSSSVFFDISYYLHTVIFTPGVCAAIYSFAFEKGIFSKFFNNNVSRSISKIGRYGFLIHYVAFDVIRIVLVLLSQIISSDDLLLYMPLIKSTLGLILTYLLSLGWLRLQKHSEKNVIQ